MSEVYVGQDPELIRQLYELFFETTPARIIRLRNALMDKNFSLLLEELQSLSLNCGVLKQKELVRVCQQIEKLYRAGDRRACAILIENFDRIYQELRLELSCAAAV